MRGPSTKFRIALGQAGMLVSLLLTAALFGLIPDRHSAVFEGRASLAEAIAANSSMFITRKDLRRLESDLQLVVKRNPNLLSAAVRKENGKAVVTVGEHEQHWQVIEDGYSTDSQLQVPIWAGKQQWGQVELRFHPLLAEGWLGILTHPLVVLIGFIALCSFAAFYFYLGKMLKHLDPSQAIPSRVRSALDTMAEGLLVLDPKKQVVLANQAFANIIQKSPDELLGYRASAFPWATTDGLPLPDEQSPWNKALREGVVQKNVMIRLQDNDSTWRTFMVNCTPILTGGGKPGGALISFDDVTQLENKEIELRKSKQEAEEANRAKSEFLANMSHEIRTPMNAILGFTDILKRGYGKSERDVKKHLSTIHSSGKHLLDLINDILDLSKVESGHVDIEHSRCAAHGIILEVVQVLRVKAREKGISLDYEPDGPLPETILTDSARLRQIVTNLAGNAIKFTEQGGVKVITRLQPSGTAPKLIIDVIDSGIGMSENQLDTIFDPFAQADSSITRRFGGTGLGLSISRRFAEALGGGISVRSEIGKGSTFTVSIDTGPLDGLVLLQPRDLLVSNEPMVSEEQSGWQFPDARVLVVDDGAENRELVSLVLGEVGLQVDTATNGKEGVDRVLAEAYDIILMDVQMPVMDGYTAVRLLREHGVDKPVIALTAHAMKGIEEKCLAAGYTGYMTKPIDIDLLISKLAKLLNGHRTERTRREETNVQTGGDAPAPNASAAPVHPIVSSLPAGDPRFRRLIERFVIRLDGQLDVMENTWKEGNLQELASLAHWLKGAGGTVGFDVFTEPARHLEDLAKEGDSESIQDVIAELRHLFSRIEVTSSEGGGAESVQTVTTPVNRTSSTSEPLVSRLPADNPRFRDIIQRFVRRLVYQMDAMERAWEERNLVELAELAHWLKGSAGTVGFDTFTDPAQNLEQFAKTGAVDQIGEAITELRCMVNRVADPSEETTPELLSRVLP